MSPIHKVSLFQVHYINSNNIHEIWFDTKICPQTSHDFHWISAKINNFIPTKIFFAVNVEPIYPIYDWFNFSNIICWLYGG